MYQTQLFQILRTFSSEEWKGFGHHLLSTTHAKAEIVLLYQYISKRKDDLHHKKLELDYANAHLFGKKTRKNFLNLLSKLHNQALDYITVREFKKDERERALYTFLALNHRGLHHKSARQYTKYLEHLDQLDQDLWNGYYQLRAHHELKFSDNQQKPATSSELIATINNNWDRLKSTLDAYYRLDTINTHHIYPHQSIKLQPHPNVSGRSISELLNILISARLSEDYSVDTSEVYEWLLRNQNNLSPNIGVYVTLHLFQYYQLTLKKGADHLHQLSDLVTLGLKTGWLLDHDQISYKRYMTVTSILCFTKTEKETKQIIEGLDSKLSSNKKEEVVLHARATIASFYGHYNDALDLLNDAPYSSPTFSTHGRILKLICYYKLYAEDYDFIVGKIENARVYHNRKKAAFSTSHYEGVLRFCKILKMLCDRASASDIRKEIEDSKHLVRRIWLSREVNKMDQ